MSGGGGGVVEMYWLRVSMEYNHQLQLLASANFSPLPALRLLLPLLCSPWHFSF